MEVEGYTAPPAPEENVQEPKNISLGGFKRNVTEKPEPAGQEAQKNINLVSATAPAPGSFIQSHTRNIVPVKSAEISDKQIAVSVNDVLPQIPKQLLKTGRVTGTKKNLLFNTYELLPGLLQGKATAPVSRIMELAPELFNGQPAPADALVELPLQKIVSQIGVFPGRPDQVDEVYPRLDAQYAKMALEKGGAPAIPLTPAQPPAATGEAVSVDQAPVSAVEFEALMADAPAPVAASRSPMAPIEAPPVAAEIPAHEPGSNGNGSAASHAEEPAEAETVSYSLAAIFPHVPQSWLDGKLKSVAPAARIIVPFDLVEVQLATGRVELPFADFFQALPEDLKSHFSGDKAARSSEKVLIPLHEVFQNLPGVEPLPPPSKPQHPGPEDELETKYVSEIEEPQAEVAAEAAVAAEPAAIEAGKPGLLPAETHEPVAEAEPPAPVEAALVHEDLLPAAEHAPEALEPAISQAAPEEAPVAQTEPAAKVEEPVAKTEPAAVAPLSEPVPEPPKVEAEPAPAAVQAEPPPPDEQDDGAFITPRIHVHRMAPPHLLPTEDFVATPEPSGHEQQEEAIASAPVEPVAHTEPATTPASPTPAAHVEPVELVAPAEPGPAWHPTTRNFIVTDGKLDARKIVEHLILLPGVKAASLTIKGKTRTAGEMPENFLAAETGKTLFQSLEGNAPKGVSSRAITLHNDEFSSTFFKQNSLSLCVLHRHYALETESHYAVLLVMQEIARLRQP